MSSDKVQIRRALKNDMKYVYELIKVTYCISYNNFMNIHIFLLKELASFQKLEDQVKLNAETLEKDGFDTSTPAFNCFVAEHDQKIVGYILYFFCYSTFLGKSVFIEDLYVRQNVRRRGIGKRLVKEVAKVALDHCCRLDFHVLSWNPAVKFYETLGAVNLSNVEKWSLFRLNKDALVKLTKDT